MDRLKEILLRFPGHYIAAGVLSAAMGLFRYFTLPQGVSFRFACYEILSVSGAVTTLVGMMLTASYFGAFDLFGFVFARGKRKYRDYADYTELKTQERARGGYIFVPYYVVGILVFLVSFLFRA